jgi:hypothetical protein
MAGLFSDDGVWDGATGRAAIEARVRSIVPVAGEGPRRILVERGDPDRWSDRAGPFRTGW